MALDFFAGCLGGCAGVIVGHPFDTVKVRLQTQSVAKPLYRGTLHCFASTIKKESFFGLYKGMASPLYGLAAINAIVFGVQGNVSRRMTDPNSLLTHFLAGSVAGFSQCIICSPMELAKTRMQIQGLGESRSKYKHTSHAYTGPVDCLRKIYHTEGLRGLSRGFSLTVIREIPAFGFYFLSYEYMCRLLQPADPTAELPMPSLLFAGGMAGICAWIVTYPADVVKSRVQASNKLKGFRDGFAATYREGGVRAFSTGLCSTLLRAFPVNAATFATVTMVLRASKAETLDDDGYLDMAAYAKANNPPHAQLHLPALPNFDSHP